MNIWESLMPWPYIILIDDQFKQEMYPWRTKQFKNEKAVAWMGHKF